MLKQIVLAGAAAAVVLGAGTAALAASGTTSPAASASSGTAVSSAGSAGNAKAAKSEMKRLHRALHAQWVTRDGKSKTTFVTHDAIRGEVTAVSAGSITVKAQDGVSQSYAVTAATKVHTRGEARGKTGSISEVHSGDKVAVTGTGTTSLTARHVLDITK